MAKSKLLKFQSRGSHTSDKHVIEQGNVGGLSYQIFKRGNIHIYDPADQSLMFKKDCDLFEEALKKLDLKSLKDGDSKSIPGSGDNDTLVFTCANGDIQMSLNKRSYGVIDMLDKVIKTAKGSKAS